MNLLDISKFSDLIGQPRANSPPIWGAALICRLTALSYLYRSYAALYPAAFRSATCRRKWLMQSPTRHFITSAIRSSDNALIRGFDSPWQRLTLRAPPCGQRRRKKRERSAGYGRRSFIPPGFFIQFFLVLASCLVYAFLWRGRCIAVLSPCTYFGANQFP